MALAYTGEIRMFSFNYAPEDWLYCNGGTVQMYQYQMLYALYAGTYGPFSNYEFRLPDLRGRVPLHSNNGTPGPGLTSWPLGQQIGSPSVGLTENTMPEHTHEAYTLVASPQDLTDQPSPQSAGFRRGPQASASRFFSPDNNNNTNFSENTLGYAGSSEHHENRQPYLTLNFCVCALGDWPTKPD
jgi:microcystin-dependent protein